MHFEHYNRRSDVGNLYEFVYVYHGNIKQAAFLNILRTRVSAIEYVDFNKTCPTSAVTKGKTISQKKSFFLTTDGVVDTI